MRFRPVVSLAASAALLAPCGAQAARLPTLQVDGAVVRRAHPGVDAREAGQRTVAPGGRATHLEERRSDRPTTARASKGRRRNVLRELRRMRDEGSLDLDTYRARRDAYKAFRDAVGRFDGARRADMAGVLALVKGIAARGALTPSRLEQLWVTMERNREWWNEGPLLASGARVGFQDSELVWQYVPGQGLQVHPLANFGKLNALWRRKRGRGRLERLLGELLVLPAERAGGLAWEYTYTFGGGAPPWVSGLAQGTGLQAMGRAAVKLGRGAELTPVLRRGLGIFRTAPPEGIAVDGEGGTHYLQYSYAPGLRILNGFVQSLVGLYDFAVLATDAEAQALFLAGEASARNEVPTFDTGAWSLYSRGSITRESDLNYHRVLRDFLASLCDRTAIPAYCDAEAAFTRYETESPVLDLTTRRVRGGKRRGLRFTLSKVSDVTLTVSRRGRTVLTSSARHPYGTRKVGWKVPRRRGRYAVVLAATDLAGNASRLETSVKVLKPRKKKRRDR